MGDALTWTSEHLESVRASGVHKIVSEYWATEPRPSSMGPVGRSAHFVTFEISDPGEPPEPGLRRFAHVLLRGGASKEWPRR